MKTKEEILYNNIEKRGGLKGVSFEEFKVMVTEGTNDMVNGLKATFEAMEEYSDEKIKEYKQEKCEHPYHSVHGSEETDIQICLSCGKILN